MIGHLVHKDLVTGLDEAARNRLSLLIAPSVAEPQNRDRECRAARNTV